MAGVGSERYGFRVTAAGIIALLLASTFVSSEPSLKQEVKSQNGSEKVEPKAHKSGSSYKHVWPNMKFGWTITVGTMLAFVGAAFGSVGGVGGGGIFIPMLTLIIGFDTKSSAAISKCLITGVSVCTVFYNLKQRHPTLEKPLIDYSLALLIQPMLMLGISIGVILSVIFAEWIITILLIVLCLVLSTKAFLKGVATWKKETKEISEAAKFLESNGNGSQVEEISNTTLIETKEPKISEVSILENVYWKELGLLVAVWVIILALQIAKNYTTTCSFRYWVLNFLQIPVAGGVTAYEAINLYRGQRKITTKELVVTDWKVYQLILFCFCGVMAGAIGGVVGLGGGFIVGPLLLELGIPPQVSSATTTFAMSFSASLSVVEFYLLKRFPIPYALYFLCVVMVAAFVGQLLMGKVISLLGRASLIIFILSFMTFICAISLGGVGIANMIRRIEHKEYMGFDHFCSYTT